MSKIDLAEELAGILAKIRNNLAGGPTLPDREAKLVIHLTRLSERTIHGLIDIFSVLQKQDEQLFEAYREWMLEDAGGAWLTNTITNRLGFSEWSEKHWGT